MVADWYCTPEPWGCSPFLTAASSYCSLVWHLLMFQPVHHAPAVCLLYLVMLQVKGETWQDERDTFWFSESTPIHPSLSCCDLCRVLATFSLVSLLGGLEQRVGHEYSGPGSELSRVGSTRSRSRVSCRCLRACPREWIARVAVKLKTVEIFKHQIITRFAM